MTHIHLFGIFEHLVENLLGDDNMGKPPLKADTIMPAQQKNNNTSRPWNLHTDLPTIGDEKSQVQMKQRKQSHPAPVCIALRQANSAWIQGPQRDIVHCAQNFTKHLHVLLDGMTAREVLNAHSRPGAGPPCW